MFYINSLGAGGAQRVMSNLANYFVKNDEIIFVTDHKTEEKYSLNENIKRFYISDDYAGNVLIKNIKRIIKLREIVKDNAPEVIISFLGHPNIRMLISTIGLDVKKIVSVRNDPVKEYGSTRFRRFFVNNIFYLANGIVFQTKDASTYFTEKNREKSCIIFNLVDRRFFDTCLEKDRKNIVTLGRLSRQKNHKLLIEAFAEVKDSIPRASLDIYGEGELKEELRSLCMKLGVENRVHLMGDTSCPEQVLAKARVFVLSSDYEGMPNALMEALAIGVPSISTDCPCGGSKILLRDNGGILIPVNDKKLLKDAIVMLYSNEILQEKYSKNAKVAADRFRPEKILNEWYSYVYSVVNEV